MDITTDFFERLRIDTIVIDRDSRQRSEIDTTDIDESIRTRGVLSPVIVRPGPNDEPVLVAGERRCASSLKAGFDTIPVRWLKDLSPIECQIIELEENIKRKDLAWQDIVRATDRIHRLYMTLEPKWLMSETAEKISLSPGTTSLYLRVAKEIENPKVASCLTVREAFNSIARMDARAEGDALEELLGMPLPSLAEPSQQPPAQQHWNDLQSPQLVQPVPTSPRAPVTAISFLDWAPSYNGKPFNFIHCDFPYGTDVFSGSGEFGGRSIKGEHFDGKYEDTKATYFELLKCLCINLNRIASSSCHLMFWCSAEILSPASTYAKETWAIFSQLAPSLEFQKFPLIWLKSDNKGIASDVRRNPRHVYETCLLSSRSRRQIVKISADAYASPTDNRLHPSAKPEPMLRHFMSMLVDGTTRMLDPTCGAGSSLRAADSLGAEKVIGLELDSGLVKVANQAFKEARMLRVASKGL